MKILRYASWGSRSVVAALALLLVAACGSASADSSTEISSQAANDGEVTTATTAAEVDSPSDAEQQSLADYLGPAAGRGNGGGGFAGGDDATEEQQLIQQAIQRCMQAQGFTYVPEDVGDGLRVFLATQSQGVSPAEYAETEGFGISTAFDAVLEGDFDFDESSDPNDDHLATLSAGEADAWELALQGQPPERNDEGQLIDPETGEVLQRGPGRVAGGCQLTAQTEVRGAALDLAELEDDLTALEERIESDPRVAEIQRDWVDCMSAQGFDYNDEGEARAEINAQVRPLLRSFFASAAGGDGADGADGDDAAGGQQGQRQGGGGNIAQAISGMELTAEQDAELEALQDLERSLATASLECQGDTAEEIAAITLRYEEEFINANRAALEALGS